MHVRMNIASITHNRQRPALAALLALVGIVLLGGCSAHVKQWPDQRADQVWTAAVAVANTPEYTDWHMLENKVHVAPEEGRIEIVRSLRRTLYPPRGEPTQESREWQFGVTLTSVEPPELTFETRSQAIPAWVASEAERFFKQIDSILTGGDDLFESMPDPVGTDDAPAGQPLDTIEVDDASLPGEPIVDISATDEDGQ